MYSYAKDNIVMYLAFGYPILCKKKSDTLNKLLLKQNTVMSQFQVKELCAKILRHSFKDMFA